MPGIAAATSLAAWLNVDHDGLDPGAARRLRAERRRPGRGWSRILAASVALGLLLAAAAHFRAQLQALLGQLQLGPLHAKEIAIVLVIVGRRALYPLLLFASGGLTLAELRAALSRRPGSRVGDIAAPLP